MPSTATITAKSGPALQNTALALAAVSKLTFDLDKRVLQVNQGSVIKEFDLYGVTTTTFTISGANYTVVVS